MQCRQELLGVAGRAAQAQLEVNTASASRSMSLASAISPVSTLWRPYANRALGCRLVADRAQDLEGAGVGDRGVLGRVETPLSESLASYRLADSTSPSVQIGARFLLARWPGSLGDLERAFGELAGELGLADSASRARQVPAGLALEPAVLDVLDDLECVVEAVAGLLELAVRERQLAQVGEHQGGERQRADRLGLG